MTKEERHKKVVQELRFLHKVMNDYAENARKSGADHWFYKAIDFFVAEIKTALRISDRKEFDKTIDIIRTEQKFYIDDERSVYDIIHSDDFLPPLDLRRNCIEETYKIYFIKRNDVIDVFIKQVNGVVEDVSISLNTGTNWKKEWKELKDRYDE